MNEVLVYIFACLAAVALVGRLAIHIVRMFTTKDLQTPQRKQ